MYLQERYAEVPQVKVLPAVPGRIWPTRKLFYAVLKDPESWSAVSDIGLQLYQSSLTFCKGKHVFHRKLAVWKGFWPDAHILDRQSPVCHGNLSITD